MANYQKLGYSLGFCTSIDGETRGKFVAKNKSISVNKNRSFPGAPKQAVTTRPQLELTQSDISEMVKQKNSGNFTPITPEGLLKLLNAL